MKVRFSSLSLRRITHLFSSREHFSCAGFEVGHMRNAKTKGLRCSDSLLCLFFFSHRRMPASSSVRVHFFAKQACFDVGLWVWGIPVELVIDGSKVSVLYLDTEGFENVRKSNVYDDRYYSKCGPPILLSKAAQNEGNALGKEVAFEPAKLLWLIQRDYLRK
ncbi:hypothetical protein BHE74_00043210 [Ensete ventricosum]|nr:hypothetical protein BHE74_00043210 [Ensete ventricosum]